MELAMAWIFKSHRHLLLLPLCVHCMLKNSTNGWSADPLSWAQNDFVYLMSTSYIHCSNIQCAMLPATGPGWKSNSNHCVTYHNSPESTTLTIPVATKYLKSTADIFRRAKTNHRFVWYYKCCNTIKYLVSSLLINKHIKNFLHYLYFSNVLQYLA